MRVISILFLAILLFGQPYSPPSNGGPLETGQGVSFRSDPDCSQAIVPFVADTAMQSMQYANRGDVASGRIIREENDQLDLDTSPCKADRIVRFHKPYQKSVIRKATCGDQEYDRTQVEQE